MEMGKGAVTVTQDIQNVEKCKLNNHQPKIWEVTSTLSPSCLNLSLELSIDHISIVHFLPLCYIPSPSFAIYVPFFFFYLCLPLISLPILHSLILHFSTSLIQSVLNYSFTQCCIFSLPPRTPLIFFPPPPSLFSLLCLIESDAICLLRGHGDI